MISEDPIHKYSETVQEYNEARSRVVEYGQIIIDVARCLNNRPYDLNVYNTQVFLPPEMTTVERPCTLDAQKWPSAEDIARALADLYHKRENVKSVWNALSLTDKSIVQPHPDLTKQ